MDIPAVERLATVYCNRCLSDQICRLVRDIKADGSSQVYPLCRNCNKNARTNKSKGGLWINHDALRIKGIDLDTIPIINNYLKTYGCKCEYFGCESYNTQLHHYAPRAIFGDEAERFAKGYLCESHHPYWHSKMNTPGARKT